MSRARGRNWLSEWVVAMVVVLFAITWLVQPFVIPTASMYDKLLIGDYVIVDKLVYGPAGPAARSVLPYADVRRGDLIVFRFPPDPGQTYVKRAVGLPGDRLRIVDRQVYVNGRPLEEPYRLHQSAVIESYRDNFPAPPAGPVSERGMEMLRRYVVDGELVLPEGRYFALGDNRDDSLDSRYWGLVPRENIIGKPVLVFWSFDAPTERLARRTPSWEHFADILQNFFSKTRWDRTFKLLRGHQFEAR
jgi:signal peptidase I